MLIHIHNTLSGDKEEFVPLVSGKVTIYDCGPTVYDIAHIGNMRTNISYDTIRRIFEYNGYNVQQVMNITDIDDRLIEKSCGDQNKLFELTRHYEQIFIDDIESLNILRPNALPRASEHISEMIDMVAVLIERDIAYPTKDGIYFSIGLSKDYGKLAKINLTDEVRERISNDKYEKENPRDFALWKFTVPEDGDISYPAVFGAGRPGWHIECSAMATKALGPTIDIHMGGTDLIFPHHTNEIAQSEAVTQRTFVNYWIHSAFMNVNDTKMSKSLNNFLTLATIKDEGIAPLAFRYWILTSHYRSQINFTIDAVKAAQTAYIRLVETFLRLGEVEHEHVHSVANPRDYKQEFLSKINNDFDTPGALALAWDLIKDHSLESKVKRALLLDFDKVFGLGLDTVKNMTEEIPYEINALAEIREQARKNKEWEKADALRLEIETRGYDVKDGAKEGFEVYKKK